MLSTRTNIEIVNVIKKLTLAEMDMLIGFFNIAVPTEEKLSGPKKANLFIELLKETNRKGPFTDSFQLDIVTYLIDQHYRNNNSPSSIDSIFATTEVVVDSFGEKQPELLNCLNRDGYTVREKKVVKLLPEEIVEAKTESELERLLVKFEFIESKGHLEQAITAHTNSDWAAANAQFRSFIESLLLSIVKKLLPTETCLGATRAIQLLSDASKLSPAFLAENLNEVSSNSASNPYVNGFWKRLHPEGSHPGLSDKEDSTFRYHTSIVFARYLLDRLESR